MSKQEEIKQALAAATPGPWSLEDGWNDNPMMVMRPGGNIPIAELAFENYENDGKLIAKAPEYIAYLLEENERLHSALETTLFHLKKEYYMSAEDAIEEALEVGQEGEGNQL